MCIRDSLTDDQRSFLEDIIHRGKPAASTIRHAYILLHADKPDNEVAEIVRCRAQSAFNIRKTFVTQGLDAALHRKIRDAPPDVYKRQDGESSTEDFGDIQEQGRSNELLQGTGIYLNSQEEWGGGTHGNRWGIQRRTLHAIGSVVDT